MKKIFSYFLMLTFFITGCAQNNSTSKVLNFYSWAEYMDPDVISDFEKKFHAKVNISYFATNEEAITKIEQEMKLNHGHSSYDVFLPSDYFVGYMKKKNLLEPLNWDHLPNIKNNILDFLKHPSDPDHKYAVPYTWGSIGIIYNKKEITEPVKSWQFILNPDKKYQNQILMIDAPKELIGVALKSCHFSFNSSNKQELQMAENVLKTQAPFVINYNGDMIQESLSNSEAMMAVSWSAEASYAIHHNPDLDFIIPEEGSNLYMDEFVILKNSPHKKLAEEFINFFYENSSQIKNWKYMYMPLPSKSAIKELPISEQNDKRWYPNQETINKLEFNQELNPKTLKIIQDIYTRLKS